MMTKKSKMEEICKGDLAGKKIHQVDYYERDKIRVLYKYASLGWMETVLLCTFHRLSQN